ncbi:serine/threonine-protein kinase PknK [Catenulispora sp. GP43]|uniref:serine/threonine-protein kinase n=1 Tax=Catenulispora sp. GP43 TaxID=3156263 RepID=UPI003513CC41
MTRHSGSTGTAPKVPKAAQAAERPERPERVRGYRDLTRIGHGGFSVVYRAVQESFERDVALKLLTIVGPDEDARRRFEREVRLAGRLSDHPHVVTVLDTGTTAAGRPYLAMDLYDGGSMKQWLNRRGPLSGPQAAGVGAKIADALHAAHALGVLHRDVKPNNILVSRYGEPALADFGVSWLLDASNSSSVLDVFSPQHAAPELMTRGVPTASSDVYALGSTLYELIAGHPPFGGPGQDVRRTIYLALSEPAPRLECPDMPGLPAVIERAMAKEPEDRFPDAAAFGRALRALIPDGRSAALVMADPEAPAFAAAPPSPPEPVLPAPADPSGSVDMTDAMAVYSGDDDYVPRPDDTMVRPDRVDADAPIPGPRGGSRRRPEDRRVAADGGRDSSRGGGRDSGRDGGRDGRDGRDAGRGRRGGYGERSAVGADAGGRRGAGKPLAVVALLAVVAVGAYFLVTSQGSATSKNTAAPGLTPTTGSTGPASTSAAAHSSSASSSSRSSSSSSPSETRHSSSAAPSHTVTTTVASSSAPGLPPATSATGPLLPANFHRLRNSATGDCLAQSGGGAGHQGCADVKGQGWESTVPLTGILGAVTGQEELVNGDSNDCLTGGGGVSIKSCSGDMAQLWSKTGGSGGATELQNGADLLCLKAAGGSVSEAPCDGDPAEMWAEDGTV